jgi:hypothetical protein
MAYVKSEIKRLSKEAGSKAAARKEAEKWFQDSLKDRSVTEAKYTRYRFEPGKIYVFKYEDPKYTKELPWRYKNPVVLAIEQVDKNDLGINLNLLPVKIKEELLDDLYRRLEPQIKSAQKGKDALNATGQKPLRITYEGIKKYLERYGFEFAIRQYIPERKKEQAVVTYNRWPDIALCNFIELNGATVNQIRRLFNQR